MRGARPELRIVGEQDTGRHLENGTCSGTISSADNLSPAQTPQSAGISATCADKGSDCEPLANLPKVPFPNTQHVSHLPDQVANVGDLNEPPADLQPEMHDEWRRIVTDLKERRLYNASMLGVVRSYCMAQWMAMQAEKSITELGVMVAGAGGAMKPNPATGLLRSSRDMISRLSAELGLTPTSRSRKSLQPAGPDLFSKDKWDL